LLKRTQSKHVHTHLASILTQGGTLTHALIIKHTLFNTHKLPSTQNHTYTGLFRRKHTHTRKLSNSPILIHTLNYTHLRKHPTIHLHTHLLTPTLTHTL